ncbi:hypothetical protein, partial [Parachitinimonas caeni]
GVNLPGFLHVGTLPKQTGNYIYRLSTGGQTWYDRLSVNLEGGHRTLTLSNTNQRHAIVEVNYTIPVQSSKVSLQFWTQDNPSELLKFGLDIDHTLSYTHQTVKQGSLVLDLSYLYDEPQVKLASQNNPDNPE